MARKQRSDSAEPPCGPDQDTPLSPAEEDALLGDLLRESHGQEVAQFIQAWLRQRRRGKHATDATPRSVQQRAKLIGDTLSPRSRISRLLRRSCETTYRRSGEILSPYIEADDLVSITREKLWGLPDPTLRSLDHNAWPRLIATIARNALIDQIRHYKPKNSVDWNDVGIVTEPTSERAWPNIDAAFSQAGLGHPEWLMGPIRSYLLEELDSPSALQRINDARRNANLPPWSPAAFRQFLHRFRKSLRDALSL